MMQQVGEALLIVSNTTVERTAGDGSKLIGMLWLSKLVVTECLE
jgi:hypothetical protein